MTASAETRNFCKGTGAAVGAAAGLAGAVAVVPVALPSLLFLGALAGATFAGTVIVGGAAAVAHEIFVRRKVHALCEGDRLMRPSADYVARTSAQKNNNG